MKENPIHTIIKNDNEELHQVFHSAVVHLIEHDVKTMDELDEKQRYGSAPIRNSYFGICSSGLINQIKGEPNFLDSNMYPLQYCTTLSNEWGAIGNVRILRNFSHIVKDDLWDIAFVGSFKLETLELDLSKINPLDLPGTWIRILVPKKQCRC